MKKVFFSLILSLSVLFALGQGHQFGKDMSATSNSSYPSLASGAGSAYGVAYEFSGDQFLSIEASDFSSISSAYNVSGRFYAGDRGPNYDLYVINSDNNQLYVVDVTGNNLVYVADVDISTENPTGMSYHSNSGTMFLSTYDGSNSNLYILNTSTGDVNLIGSNSDLIIDIAVSPSGTLYGIDIYLDNLVEINTSDGSTTIIGYTGFDANYAQGMDFDDTSGELIWASYSYSGNPGNGIRVVDVSDGSSTLIEPFPNEIDCLAIGPAKPVPFNIYFIISAFVLIGIGIVVKKRFF